MRTKRDLRISGSSGSVLIIVLWVAFGLVALALYFAQSMTYELRASDNRTANVEAEQAIDGASRYVSYVLKTLGTNGAVPDLLSYHREGILVGDARYWLIGRSDQQNVPTEPVFGLVDETSKLNLNTATSNMLLMLPRMTPELAAAIIDWRDTDSNVSQGGAESETYLRRQPPYNCKNAPFDTVDELRLVMGMDLDLLYGEDANLNGILDLNENDGNILPPIDNRDNRLDHGLLEYVTVYSRQPNASKTNITDRAQLQALLQENFEAAKAAQIVAKFGPAPRPGQPPTPLNIKSVLEFYIKSEMTLEEFRLIGGLITVSTNAYTEGLINVNTASPEVLACVPGIGIENAPALVSYRQSNVDKLDTVGWVKEVLEGTNAIAAGPYITTESYQFSADLAAVGHYGRGYSRVKFIFDTSEGTPKIRYRQDLTRLGWALGTVTQRKLELAKETR
jgi:type II secretory pathway component PulK